jgi:F420-dependent oxidoreductase-like protein
MTAPLRFGVFVPQGWKLEYTGFTAQDAWARSKEIAQLAESLGYDHLWVYDHVETVPRRRPTHMFEAYTMLAAIAQHTSTVKLGQLVTCIGYRNVGLLAKEAACVDVFSEGRLILGVGAGWYNREYRAYGYEYPSDRERLERLDEAMQVIKPLWTDETVTFEGKHLRFDRAFCDPKPIQQLPEIWIGGGGEKVTLRIAAEHADKTNWQVDLDTFKHKSEVLRGHCDKIGRDFDTIGRTHAPDCRIFDSEADTGAWLESDSGGHLWGMDPNDQYLAANLVGTVEQVTEKTQAFIDAGCREFVLWMRDYPSTESVERFMREVVPHLQG